MSETMLELQVEDDHKQGHRTVTVTVNRKPVTFHERAVTGLQIKQTAMAQGVAIQADFTLSIREPGRERQIADTDTFQLEEGQHFTAVAPDHNS